MKPVFQTIVDWKKGDCLPACIASILEIPLSTVPNYLDELWYISYQLWADDHGYNFELRDEQPATKYYIAVYPSSMFEGRTHAVVANNGNIVHDPNPKSTCSGKPKYYFEINEV